MIMQPVSGLQAWAEIDPRLMRDAVATFVLQRKRRRRSGGHGRRQDINCDVGAVPACHYSDGTGI